VKKIFLVAISLILSNPAQLYAGDKEDLVQQIEQSYRTIHDFRVDGTLRNGARDIGPACNNFRTANHFDDGVMFFRLFNLFDAVTRRLSGEEMIFAFIDGIETRTKKICHYPIDG